MKKGLISLTVVVVFICAVAVSYAYAYALEKRDRHIIEIAFQNGFARGISLDQETRKRIKEDHAQAEQVALSLAQQYLQIVAELNK